MLQCMYNDTAIVLKMAISVEHHVVVYNDTIIVLKMAIPVEHHVAVYNDTIIVLKIVIPVEHHVVVYVYDDTIIVLKMVISAASSTSLNGGFVLEEKVCCCLPSYGFSSSSIWFCLIFAFFDVAIYTRKISIHRPS